jgi:hypothetical protein
MNTLFNWLWANIWTILFIAGIILYGKKIYQDLLFTPLAGGNGKVQMDELAKLVILIVFVYSAVVEATRKTEHHIFTDTYFFSLLLTVCAIAAIKPLFSNLNILKGKDPEKNETPA